MEEIENGEMDKEETRRRKARKDEVGKNKEVKERKKERDRRKTKGEEEEKE